MIAQGAESKLYKDGNKLRELNNEDKKVIEEYARAKNNNES